MKFLIAFTFFVSQISLAQTAGKTAEFNSVIGVDYNTNFVKNPSAKKNASNTTTSSASVSRDNSAGNLIDGVSSYSVDTSANGGYVEFTLDPITSPSDAGNCEFKGSFKGDATLYAAQILDGSANVLNQISPLTNETGWRLFSVLYPCGISRKIRITQTVAGTSPAINVGKLYYGIATNIGAGVPNNVFSAKVSSTGVVSDETQDFINGSCVVSDTSSYACTLVTGVFPNAAPTCTITLGATTDPSANASSVTALTISTSTVSYRTSLNATNTARPVNISCTRAGTDFIQPAITPNQWNYGPTAYTPTLGAGFGSPTNVSFFHWRTGKFLNVYGTFVAGTTTTSVGSISLPSGLTLDTANISINNTTSNPGQHVGDYQTIASNGLGKIVTATGTSTSLLYFANNNSNSAMLTPSSSVSGTVSASTQTISVSFRVPIAGWTENQNAPQLLGSVTSNANSALRTESALISSGGVVSGETSDFINGNCSASSPYACTFVSGTWSATPICVASAFTTGGAQGSYVGQQIYSASSSGFTLATFNASFVNANYATSITCIGPR